MADPLDVDPEPLVPADLGPYFVEERSGRYRVIERATGNCPISFSTEADALDAARRLNVSNA
jgi:hypothetical protein